MALADQSNGQVMYVDSGKEVNAVTQFLDIFYIQRNTPFHSMDKTKFSTHVPLLPGEQPTSPVNGKQRAAVLTPLYFSTIELSFYVTHQLLFKPCDTLWATGCLINPKTLTLHHGCGVGS